MNGATSGGVDVFDVVILGAGSGGEALAASLAETHRVAVVEAERVGGECPFVACMPSKSLLHDAHRGGRDWAGAVARRDEVVEHHDDSGHRQELVDAGVVVVSGWGRLDGERSVLVGGRRLSSDTVVIATGADFLIPPVPGLDAGPYWTAADALTSVKQPSSLVILGGGPIGCELADLYASFGTAVTLIDSGDALATDLERGIGDLLCRSLAALNVHVVLGVHAEEVAFTEPGAAQGSSQGMVRVRTKRGDHVAQRLLVATGKAPRTTDLGLEALGIDLDAGLPVDPDGRVGGLPWLWAVGDVVGTDQYTHAANHHAEVVAANLAGGARRFDEAVMARCIYTSPPVAAIGPTRAQLEAEGVRLRCATASYHDIARPITDELGEGLLVLLADAERGVLRAAQGVGERMDEIVGALGAVIDGAVPLDVLARSIQPFPTVSEILGVGYRRLIGDAQYEQGVSS